MKIILRRIFYETSFVQVIVKWAQENKIIFGLMAGLLTALAGYNGSAMDSLLWMACSFPASFYFCKINDVYRSEISIPAPPFSVKISSPDQAMFWRPVSFLYFLSLLVLALIADYAGR